ncbi:MAG: protein translocase subunit SecF [Myxococcales bacterium]|nr:protein translocase subunit SecF [Myxococcales bacterium]
MEFFKPGSVHIDFMGKRKAFLIISLVMWLSCLGVFVVRYLNGSINWGIDFAGGTVVDLEFEKNVDIGAVRNLVADLGYKKATIQNSGLGQEGKAAFIIRIERIAILSPEDAASLEAALREAYPDGIARFEYDRDGGDQFGVTFTSLHSAQELKDILAGLAEKLKKPDLATVSIRAPTREGEFRYQVLMTGVAAQIERAAAKSFPEAKPEVRKVEFVGPEVGEKLRLDALLAMLYAFVGILVYIAFRFNMLFAPGAVIALVHDAFIVIGMFALFGLEMNLTFLAAVLTVIGYSINDTIVIYDRIRETMGRLRSLPLDQIMNTALNEVLNRTILTSLTTELALLGLLFMGFGEIRDFAIAMTIGIVVGTYSSIYIASALTLQFDSLAKKMKPA